MDYPSEVQEKMNVLNEYEEDDNLEYFDIFHLYPGELAYPNGYYDSRFFNLVGYNSNLMKKRSLGEHDGLSFDYQDRPQVKLVRIYADGSTLIRFENIVKIDLFQCVEVISL